MAYHIYEIGPCCEGTKCLHPNGELWPSHKCPVCGEMAHVNCGVLCLETDSIPCNSCYEKSNCITTSVVPVSGQKGGGKVLMTPSIIYLILWRSVLHR